eukprot:gene11687-18020_t
MKKIEAFFQKHHKVSDCDENCIQGEGLISLCTKRHFKYFYWFAFDWTREENMRVMQYEPAIESWQQLLKPRAK